MRGRVSHGSDGTGSSPTSATWRFACWRKWASQLTCGICGATVRRIVRKLFRRAFRILLRGIFDVMLHGILRRIFKWTNPPDTTVARVTPAQWGSREAPGGPASTADFQVVTSSIAFAG